MRLYPEHYVKILLLLGHKVVTMLERYKVEYVMCGGTLLGAVRQNGMIPHDYDLDGEVLSSLANRKRFFEMVKYVNANTVACGFRAVLQLPVVVKFVPQMELSLLQKFGLNNPDIPNPTFDMFIQEPRRGGGTHILGNQWPTWYYKPGELYPLRKLDFSGFQWSAPNKPEKILRRYYGADWRVPRYYEWPKC